MIFNLAAKNRQKKNRDHNTVHNLMQPLEQRRMLSITPAVEFIPDAAASAVPGYAPSQIVSAYGFNGISFNSGKTAANGAGQTIAIVDAYNDPNIAGDLKTFDARFGLATASLKVVNQTGGSTLPATNAGWAQEISLDVEWAHAVAPGANLVLVETSSDSTPDLLAGVNYARSGSGVSVVSMSWGGSEFNGEKNDDTYFTTPSGHTGVTFVAASGDNGSAYGVDWPASSPDVLSVGGTSLTLTASGAYSSETGWSGSGGGASQLEGEPEYQAGVQSLGVRTVPDVAAAASPSTGVAVYDSLSYSGEAGWMEFGGTSAAAPQWAALISIADQGRVLNKLSTLNGATNTLPTLYGLEANAGTYAADFHDVASGASSNAVRAGAGYDEVTGIGTPRANTLISALIESKVSTALTQTAVPTYGPPHYHWGYFVDSQLAFPTQLLPATSTSFTATITGLTPIDVSKALFETNLLTSGGLGVTASIGSGVSSTASPATVATTVTWQSVLAEIKSSPSAVGVSVLQALRQDAVALGAGAEQMISDLVRDVAMEITQSASAAGVTMETLIAPENGLQNTVIVAGAAIAVGAYLQLDSDKKKITSASVFSERLVQFSPS